MIHVNSISDMCWTSHAASVGVLTGTLTATRGTRQRKLSLNRQKVCFPSLPPWTITVTHEATSVLTFSRKMNTLCAVVITQRTEAPASDTSDIAALCMDTFDFPQPFHHTSYHSKWENPLNLMPSLPLFTILHGTLMSVIDESERARVRESTCTPCLFLDSKVNGPRGPHLNWGSVRFFVSIKM